MEVLTILYLNENWNLTKEKISKDFYESPCNTWSSKHYLQMLREDGVRWNTSTPYDDVGKTMLHDCRRWIFPLLNEVFGTNYTGIEKIKFLRDEYQMNQIDGATEKRLNDSYFEVETPEGSRKYHIEFQSYLDHTLVLRMFEYDIKIAVDESTLEGNKLTVLMPRSAILYLQHKENTPDEMQVEIITPDGNISYMIPVMKVQYYSLTEIFEKKLLLLLPFYIFSYRKRFKKIENNQDELKMLKEEFAHIRESLDWLCETGDLTAYEKHTILNMTKKVIDHLAKNYKKIREEVSESMGGKILDHEAKDILRRGYDSGYGNGYGNGYDDGMKVTIVQFVKDGIIGIAEGAKRLGLKEEEFAKYM